MGLDRLARQVDKEARDLRILAAIVEQGPIGIESLADATDVPDHKVRHSLRMLEDDGLVEPTPDGARPAEDLPDRAAEIDAGIDRLIERLEAVLAEFGDATGADA